MSALGIASVVFVCCFGAALIGLMLHRLVPERHLDDDSKDTVKLVMGLLATMSALVLGLLIATAKGIGCHTETRPRMDSLNVTSIARIGDAALPPGPWTVRNFGWSPPIDALQEHGNEANRGGDGVGGPVHQCQPAIALTTLRNVEQ